MIKYYLVSFTDSDNEATTDYNKAVEEFEQAVFAEEVQLKAMGKRFAADKVRREVGECITLEMVEVDDEATEDDVTVAFCDSCGLGTIKSTSLEEIFSNVFDDEDDEED